METPIERIRPGISSDIPLFSASILDMKLTKPSHSNISLDLMLPDAIILSLFATLKMRSGQAAPENPTNPRYENKMLS